MPLLTRDQILSATDLAREEVEVPEWGGSVIVRGMTAKERDEYEAGIVDRHIVTSGKRSQVNIEFNDDYFINLKARLCAKTICDENGDRIFSDMDVEALGRKSAAALNRVADVAQRLSGISQEDMESLGKTSEATQLEDSSSDSHLRVVGGT